LVVVKRERERGGLARTLTSKTRVDGDTETFIVHSLTSAGADASEDGTGRGTPLVPVPVYSIRTAQTSSNGWGVQKNMTGSLDSTGSPAIASALTVRRLTPKECERLQGFPDDWTTDQSDAARYRQLGNAVAVPVFEWIGRRIVAVDAA
jgi:DNA (cytosine-5)-methyltransferase 1